MVKIIISLIAAFFLVFNSSAQLEKSVNKVVNLTECKSLLKMENIQLIDVRTVEEYKGGHIGNAKNIDFYSSDFRTQLSKFSKNKPVLVYCHSGGRSGKTSLILKELGFLEVYDFQSGYSKWGK